MRSPMDRVAPSVITDGLADAWGLAVAEFRYFPEGGGAYHWITVAHDGQRWFVTCDDLDTKPWLGDDRDSVFEGLTTAYATAIDLHGAGLEFVVAPVASRSGVPAERIDDRHSISVFAHVDGEPGHWGQPLLEPARGRVVPMLARLHRSAPPARALSRRAIEVPGRADLELALGDLDRVWDGGPLSDLARRELADHHDAITQWLADLDRFAQRLADDDAGVLITHGEPHPGNLIRVGDGVALVDWDTVAVARRERDLWMLDDGLLSDYQAMTGVALDRDALMAYRLLWALADAASFVAQLRGEHERTVDNQRALVALRGILELREPAPYGASP